MLRASHRLALVALSVPLLLFTGCPPGTEDTVKLREGSTKKSTSSTSGTSGSSPASYSSYYSATSTKIVFNKQSFYSNYSPNPSSCAGDARYYYDTETERRVPTKPSWVKNVAVELTNSNVGNGGSKASSCSIFGGGAANAANCASFDDLQVNTGTRVRSILVGGTGCSSPSTTSTTCSNENVLSDIWAFNTSDVSTSHTWAQASTAIPRVAVATSHPGLVWASAGYDELHDEFYLFGGARALTSSTSSNLDVNTQMIRIRFNADKSVSTASPPALVDISTRMSYAGWESTTIDAAISGEYPSNGRIAATLTYSMRRDPSMKKWCRQGDAFCWPSSRAANSAIADNQHSDYLLLVGGVTSTGDISDNIYSFTPHGFSPDVGTYASKGDWTLLSPFASGATSTTAMKIVDLALNGSSNSAPFTATPVGSFTPSGVAFSGWPGRAYHRTVYDPTMNRFYIFGGLENHDPFVARSAVNITAPDISTSDIWIYDPPAIGRRPTGACFTQQTPDGLTTLPATTSVMNAQYRLENNQNYLSQKFIFPPGGCLQRVKLTTAPTSRFEHAMAFDSNQKAIMVFGGCNTTSTIAVSGSSTVGDPLGSCNSTTALLQDTWLYLPPETTEVVPSTYTDSTTQNPYFSDTVTQFFRQANIFGTEHWLHWLPVFASNNTSNATLALPTTAQTLGTWIQLSPTNYPTKRAGAQMVYDRAHGKFYLFGGYGCKDSSCTLGNMNDVWEYTPPNIATECDRDGGYCTTNGTWTQIRGIDGTASDLPPLRRGSSMAFAESNFSYGDDFYTVTDSACIGQGPTVSFDSSVNRQLVGAIYVDIDRASMNSDENLLINLKMLPFNEKTKLPGVSYNGTLSTSVDDKDNSESTDQALFRVQLLTSPFGTTEQVQSTIQPRYYEFLSGTPKVADEFVYAAGPSGQVTEKQLFIPLKLNSNINMIKIERISGSIKFYEMSLHRF